MRLWIVPIAGIVGIIGIGCGDSKEDWPIGRPRIDDVNFLEQTPGDPGQLAFSVQFTDADGDLGTGSLTLLLDCEESSVLPLDELFAGQIPPLAGTTTEGTLEVYVNVDGVVDQGRRIEFGFILEDAAGLRSNEPSVTLEAIQK